MENVPAPGDSRKKEKDPFDNLWWVFLLLSVVCFYLVIHDGISKLTCLEMLLAILFGYLSFVFGVTAALHHFVKKKTADKPVRVFIFALVVGFFILLAIPNFIPVHQKDYCPSARSAGNMARVAEEIYYTDGKEGGKGYTTDLNLLLEVDRNLTDDAQVTFAFLQASDSGFTFYTQHNRCNSGERNFYTEEDHWIQKKERMSCSPPPSCFFTVRKTGLRFIQNIQSVK